MVTIEPPLIEYMPVQAAPSNKPIIAVTIAIIAGIIIVATISVLIANRNK